MGSERFQRRKHRMLDQIGEAADQRDWKCVAQLSVAQLSNEVLAVDGGSTEAQSYLEAAALTQWPVT
jgi:hypothetical protein